MDLLTQKLNEAISCIVAHPEGKLATKYHATGRCSWAYKWPGGGDSWSFQADPRHPALVNEYLPDYFGLPECFDRYEQRVGSAWASEVYHTNAFEL